MNISFGSTYRIAITQTGINNAKKERLKQLIESYPNGMIGKSKTGYARVSIPNSEDDNFVRKLKTIGYKVFQKFEGENISTDKLDMYIKEKLDTREYNQLGKNKKRLTAELRKTRRYDNSFDAPPKKKRNDELIVDDIESVSESTVATPKVAPKHQVSQEKKRYMYPEVIYTNDYIIRNSYEYKKARDEYGVEAAEFIFFGTKS